MNQEKDILLKHKKKNSKTIYNIPENYFENLNNRIDDRIKILESNTKVKVGFLNGLLKVAAVFLFIIGSYFIFKKSSNKISLNYVQLNNSIDEYLISDDELYYTFITDKDLNHLNINENIDDYLEIKINF
ncbi:hypothetical protein OAD79_05380 [Flavobacteriales bacterium]|nr:hypothetical protein [Flavobacteriales bacterium]